MTDFKSFNRPVRTTYNKPFTIGTWLTIPHPSIAEILSRLDFDWLVVDLEHSAISLETCAEMLRIIDLTGKKALVRIGDHNPNTIKRVMDAGAHGIIASTVNTVAQAEQIVRSVKYPPMGERGVGLSRAQGYGEEFEKHYEWLNQESLVIAQIEHHQGLTNLEQILKIDGIDGIFVGPFDLSASLNIPGDFSNPIMVEALDKVIKIGKESNKYLGIHVVQPNHEDLKERVMQGFNMIAFGIDYLFMLQKAKGELTELEKK
jgi:2-keto-3-deoxy-L-rhamnonate aldolase RhmA